MTLLLEALPPDLKLDIELKYCNFVKFSAVVGEESRKLDKLGTMYILVSEINIY